MGLAVAEVSASDGCDPKRDAILEGVQKGKYQVVFFTPKMILLQRKWRKILSSDVYTNRIKGLIIDEAHCVPKW